MLLTTTGYNERPLQVIALEASMLLTTTGHSKNCTHSIKPTHVSQKWFKGHAFLSKSNEVKKWFKGHAFLANQTKRLVVYFKVDYL